MTPTSVQNPDAIWITVAQAARILGLSEAQVRARVKEGEIHAERYFGRTAVLEKSVKAYRDRSTPAQAS